MSYKKIIFTISFLAIFGFLFNFLVPTAEAMTAAEIRALIAQLQQQITQLQQQLFELQVEEGVWCHDFNVNLRYGDRGTEVKALQKALHEEGFTPIPYKEGDKNYGNFEQYTASAVVGFQEKYKDDILAPWGLEHGTGYVGSTTRAKLNELYGCEVPPKMCITEGKTGYGYKNDVCCEGLTKIANSSPGDRGCIQPTDTSFVCSYCGNGVCGLGENICNCSQDCKETCHTSPLWSWDYCSPTCQCYAGEGDCDSDADCYTGYCAQNVGAKYGQISTMDVCEEKIEKLTIEITKPKDGETISGTTRIEATAKSTSKLGEMGLTIAYGQLAEHTTFKDCMASVAQGLTLEGQTPYSEYTMTCRYDWNPGDYEGKADISVNISDATGDKATDSVTVNCQPEKCRDENYKCTIEDIPCCAGLKAVGLCNEGPADSCICATCGSICRPCGNGVCDKNENRCNCPEDCKAKSLTLTSPNGGEEWTEGETYNITWTSTRIDKVNLYLQTYAEPGEPSVSISTTIATNVSATLGKYSWKIPFGTARTNLAVSITEVDGTLSDTSDSPFSIISGPTCDQKCRDQGYQSGICRSWAISPAAEWGCQTGETGIGYTSDCYLAPLIVGVGKTCCCQGEVECRDENYKCTIEDIPCCAGLKAVGLCNEGPADSCICATCGSICRPCGNGVCDKNENRCNCPEDCKEL